LAGKSCHVKIPGKVSAITFRPSFVHETGEQVWRSLHSFVVAISWTGLDTFCRKSWKENQCLSKSSFN
jgi:hypothetical protein